MFIATFSDETGHIHIFRTDDEGEFIAHCVRQVFAECEVEATVEVCPLGDDWYRVTLRHPPVEDMDSPEFCALDAVYSAFWAKGWYECRADSQSPDGTVSTYQVRHKGGPYI